MTSQNRQLAYWTKSDSGVVMFVIKIEKPYRDISNCIRKMKPSLMGRLFIIPILGKRTILICYEDKDYNYLHSYFIARRGSAAIH